MIKKLPFIRQLSKLGYKDSNLEMTESESVALPFGDSPLFLTFFTTCRIISYLLIKIKPLF